MDLRKLCVIVFCIWFTVLACLMTQFMLIEDEILATISSQSAVLIGSSMIECERILYYRNFVGGGGGLQHCTSLLHWEMADAVHYNFTHLIVENARMNKEHGQTDFVNVTTKINESWWHYYDIDAIAKSVNLEILHYESERALQLFKKYENETFFAGAHQKCCNESLISDKCGMVTVRTKVSGWPEWWCKSFKKPMGEDWVHTMKYSQNVFECIAQSQIRTNDSSECILKARVRRGDMIGRYKLPQHRHFVSAQGVAAISAYLAHRFCAIDSKVKLYLGTNGKNEYLQHVRRNLSHFDKLQSIQLLTKHDLAENMNGTRCAQQIRQNNYFLFALEKAMIHFDNLIDAHFVVRPMSKYEKKRGVNEDRFFVFANQKNHSIYFKDLNRWLVENKMINGGNQSLFKY